MSIRFCLKPLIGNTIGYTIPYDKISMKTSVSPSYSLKQININEEFSIEYYPASSASTRKDISSADSGKTKIDPCLKMIEVKIFLASAMGIRPDCLQLYQFQETEQITKISDFDNLIKILEFNTQKKLRSVQLFFQIIQNNIRVVLDFFQMNISQIIFDLADSCSIYMLKYFISSKLGNAIPISEQVIFGIGVIDKVANKTYGSLTCCNSLNNIECTDNLSLRDIINYYDRSNLGSTLYETISGGAYVLSLLLIKRKKDKVKIGLDFRFNFFKNFKKIEFHKEAPSYREVGDGINLLSYCKNTSCKIFEQLFVNHLGYGNFDILSEIESSQCPKCKVKDQIEVRNIGIVNSKWVYKGNLNGKKPSHMEGDGFTVDEKLYVLPEVNLAAHLGKFIMEVEPYYKIPFINHAQLSQNNEGKSYDENDDCNSKDLESISLYLPENENKEKGEDNKTLMSFHDKTIHSCKIINSETNYNPLEIELENSDTTGCVSCYSIFSCAKNGKKSQSGEKENINKGCYLF